MIIKKYMLCCRFLLKYFVAQVSQGKKGMTSLCMAQALIWNGCYFSCPFVSLFLSFSVSPNLLHSVSVTPLSLNSLSFSQLMCLCLLPISIYLCVCLSASFSLFSFSLTLSLTDSTMRLWFTSISQLASFKIFNCICCIKKLYI